MTFRRKTRWGMGAQCAAIGVVAVLAAGLSQGRFLAFDWSSPANLAYVAGLSTPAAVIGFCVGWFGFWRS